MSKGIGAGDKLARGAARATYAATEGGLSDKKWNDIFDSYDPEAFRNAPNKSSVRSDAGLQETGDVSFNAPEAAE